MSVRKGERKDSNLKYVQDAQILCAHTLQLCNNSNRFPEPVLANNIKQEALKILENVRYMLAAYTYEKDNEQLHLRYQLDAFAHIDALYALLELAYNDKTYTIEPKSMEYWTGLIVNLEDSLKQLGLVPIC